MTIEGGRKVLIFAGWYYIGSSRSVVASVLGATIDCA
jgi:hypothetical protein